MINLETDEVVLEVESDTLAHLMAKTLIQHTEEFGEDYLDEVLAGLHEMVSENTRIYIRHEFSDPESNFKLVITE